MFLDQISLFSIENKEIWSFYYNSFGRWIIIEKIKEKKEVKQDIVQFP